MSDPPERSDWLGNQWRKLSSRQQLVVVLVALGVVLGGAGLSELLSRPSPPSVEERTFLQTLGSIQQDEGDAKPIEVGRDICEALRNGEDPSATARYFGASDPRAVGLQHGLFLAAATADGSLCPDQRDVVSRWADRQ
jgi:hypothetical protein